MTPDEIDEGPDTFEPIGVVALRVLLKLAVKIEERERAGVEEGDGVP